VLLSPFLKVAVEDQFGNIVTSASTVTLTLSSGTFWTKSKTVSVATSAGIATFYTLYINTAGSYMLTASDGTLTGASCAVTVSPAAASKLVYQSAPPSTGTAGVALSPAATVAVEDQFGNVVTGDSSTVTLTLSSGTFSNGGKTASLQAVNGVATFSNLVINSAGTYTLTASDGASTKATSGNIAIGAAAATQLVLQQTPTTAATAGVLLSPFLKVAVEDQFGNIVTSASTVTLTLSSGTFWTKSKTVSVATSAGIATFYTLYINTAGSYMLTASDGTLTGASCAVTVSPAAASKLVYQSAPPSTGTAGVALSPAATVAVEDQFGNVVTGDSSTVTLTLSSGTFSNGGKTASLQAVNGVATFSNLVINTAGTYTLTASDGALTKATSGNILIGAAAATQLVLLQTPTAGTAGAALAPAVVVAVEDPYGNIVTGDTSTVTLTLSSGTFSNGSTTASAQAVNGVATFGNLVIGVAGIYTFSASDGTLTTALSGNITIGAA